MVTNGGDGDDFQVVDFDLGFMIVEVVMILDGGSDGFGSDVEEGGETIFPGSNGNFSLKRGLSVKPKMGDALLFWTFGPDLTLDPSKQPSEEEQQGEWVLGKRLRSGRICTRQLGRGWGRERKACCQWTRKRKREENKQVGGRERRKGKSAHFDTSFQGTDSFLVHEAPIAINCAGAVHMARRIAGFGVMGLDSNRNIMKVWVDSKEGGTDLFLIEAEAIRFALIKARSKGWDRINILSSNTRLVQKITKRDADDAKLATVREDIFYLMNLFTWCSCTWIPIVCNSKAVKLAFFAVSLVSMISWEIVFLAGRTRLLGSQN
ncbi:hypothetical protein ACH5RR_026347 [Cinchona calisaya]|uniref:RNase H type-1 domain-containing protein n=1 Tax=Cinchona calisaya TaxID=153742 RepID=A0ABD2Z5Q4_9GENT